jgi:prepilin-type N-terminal cleavage/methylation domain-containing protein
MTIRPQQVGFTLVELLVVITIIVVLLALLAPALDQAIQQAELAVCGANAHAAASGATVYAFDARRFYPYRTVVHDYDGTVVVNPDRLTMAANPGNPGASWDDRPLLKTVMKINGALRCPLTPMVDLEVDSGADTWILASYGLWFNWQFQHGGGASAPREKGMFKIGDRWTWSVDGVTESFSVLVSDYLRVNLRGGGRGSHPDKKGVWGVLGPHQHAPNPSGPEGADSLPGWGETWGFATYAGWVGGDNRGTIDLNFGMADGSVRRVNDVGRQVEDVGLRRVPDNLDNRSNFINVHLIVPPN